MNTVIMVFEEGEPNDKRRSAKIPNFKRSQYI